MIDNYLEEFDTADYECMKQGGQACASGIPSEMNSYSPKSKQAYTWEIGWYNAKCDLDNSYGVTPNL